MSKKAVDKTDKKRTQLVERTAKALNIDQETAAHLLHVNKTQSLRINTLVTSEAEALKDLRLLGWKGQPISWCPGGYTIEEGLDAIKQSKLFHAGGVYIQNAASWLPVLALEPHPGESILDICAAPGGKTSHIAQLANNKVSIIANDNSKPRLTKLRANLDRLGVNGVEYSLRDASRLAKHLEGQLFDKILLDAPCSGEGMMTLDSKKDFDSWSVAHIKRLQQLQKKLIGQAWQLLKPGGLLVYSTCTMAPEENEAVIDYVIRKNTDARVRLIKTSLSNTVPAVKEWNDKIYDEQVKFCLRLVPGKQAHAFFVAKLQKSTSN